MVCKEDGVHNVKVTSEEARESGESRMIMIMDHNVYLKSIVVNKNPSTKRLGKLTFPTHKVSQVFITAMVCYYAS